MKSRPDIENAEEVLQQAKENTKKKEKQEQKERRQGTKYGDLIETEQ